MGLFSSLGISSDFGAGAIGSSLLFWGGIIFLAFVILIVAGAIAFFYYFRKAKKRAFKNEIPIFVSLNGKHKRAGTDYAKEIYVPDSNISLFYFKTFCIFVA